MFLNCFCNYNKLYCKNNNLLQINKILLHILTNNAKKVIFFIYNLKNRGQNLIIYIFYGRKLTY
jgi:hypothetical protein